MIADAHCHAWRRWPYDTGVPDPDTRGSVEALLWEMDAAGVDFSAIVCARIGAGAGGAGFGNDDNNDYVADAVRAHPDRLTAWVDVDCVWRPEYHTSGAADRLRQTAARTGATGFTHYLAAEHDDWLGSDAGRELFSAAGELGLAASIAASGVWFDDIRRVAVENPRVPILLHHLGGRLEPEDRRSLLALADIPGIGVKVSGFNYSSERWWDFPYAELTTVLPDLVAAFGAHRLYWGSDFPASRDQLTYRQSVEVVRSHGGVDAEASAAILGENLISLLRHRTHPSPIRSRPTTERSTR